MTSSGELIGRSGELEAVHTALDRCRTGPTTLLIEGEPGIGKTALFLAAIDAAITRSMQVLSCRCVESELSLPFTALADLLASIASRCSDGLPPPQRRALAVALLQSDAADAPPDPRALGTALLGVLRAAAEHAPVVVAVDDPPWMDAPSSRALHFALRRVGSARISLLAARRLPSVAGGLDVLTAGPGIAQHLRVGPMTLEDVSTVLRQRIGQRVGRPSAERIHKESGGNPYFALELARAGTDRGSALVGRRGPATDGLQALVGQRVGTQPADVRHVLLLAAAVTYPTRTLIETVAGDRAVEGLAQALASELLLSEGQQLRFAHPLLANAAYWDATSEERRQAHALLAEALPQQEERARHSALAASGPDASVAAILDEAADAALSRGAPEHAAELLESALLLTPQHDRDDRVRRTSRAASARFHGGDNRGAVTLLDELVSSTPRGPDRAAALSQLARIRYHDDSIAAAIDLLEEAQAQAGAGVELRASIFRDLGWARASLGDLTTAAKEVDEAARLVPELTDRELIASVWTVSAVVSCLAGRGARLDQLAGAETLQTQPASHISVDALSCRAQILKWSDRFSESRRCYHQLRARLMQNGDEGSLPYVYFHESELELWAGRWQRSADLAQRGRDVAELTDQKVFHALGTYVLGLVDALRGRVESARSALLEALEQGQSAASVQAWVHTGLGSMELSLGNAQVAYQHLAPFADMPALLQEPGVFRFLPDLVEAQLLLGDIDGARSVARGLEDRGLSLSRSYAIATGARCRGLVAMAEGSPDGAQAAFERAFAAHEELDQPFELSRTFLAHGVMLRRVKQRGASRVSLERALAGFEQLGARLWSERASEELARVTGASAGAALTATEERIAVLVRLGHTNREVASMLSIAVKTVEVNLTRIYRKLGVRSRTELAAAPGPRGGHT